MKNYNCGCIYVRGKVGLSAYRERSGCDLGIRTKRNWAAIGSDEMNEQGEPKRKWFVKYYSWGQFLGHVLWLLSRYIRLRVGEMDPADDGNRVSKRGIDYPMKR